MNIENKYLTEAETGDGEGIPNYSNTHPEICQSCINSVKGKRGFGALECKLFSNVEVHPYGNCPRWRKVRG